MQRALIPCLVFLAGLAGCGREASARSELLPSNAQLDSGNVRFSAGDHAGALVHYRAATADEASSAAAWFGIHMASRALGDSATAAEALRHVQALVPDYAWGAHPHQATRPSPHPGPGATSASTQP